MRRLLLLVLVAGCSQSAHSGPAWPKVHEAEKDGGESLAPHESNQVAVAVEKSDDDKPSADAPKTDKPTDKPATTGGDAAAAPAADKPAGEDVLQTEDIIIEIDD